MPPSDSPEPDSVDELERPITRDAPTPRGGFMARPGLKPPPRHAVVVRMGDSPASDEIPLARSSVPPPPDSGVELPTSAELASPPVPSSDPSGALATPNESVAAADMGASEAAPSSVPPSAAPRSDAPLTASLPPPRRRTASVRLIVAFSAAAGALLALGSLLRRPSSSAPVEVVAAPAAAAVSAPPVQDEAASAALEPELDSPAPSADVVRQPPALPHPLPRNAAHPRHTAPRAVGSAKRSIF